MSVVSSPTWQRAPALTLVTLTEGRPPNECALCSTRYAGITGVYVVARWEGDDTFALSVLQRDVPTPLVAGVVASIDVSRLIADCLIHQSSLPLQVHMRGGGSDAVGSASSCAPGAPSCTRTGDAHIAVDDDDDDEYNELYDDDDEECDGDGECDDADADEDEDLVSHKSSTRALSVGAGLRATSFHGAAHASTPHAAMQLGAVTDIRGSALASAAASAVAASLWL